MQRSQIPRAVCRLVGDDVVVVDQSSVLLGAESPLGETGVEPWLWSMPEDMVDEYPTRPLIDGLPLQKLSWRDTERLLLQLLAGQAEVEFAKSFGVRGQDQEGIDVYARLPGELPRPYVVLQSKNVKSVAPSDLHNAVAKFLEGSWPERTSVFYFATTFDLTATSLDSAVRAAAERLALSGVRFVPWGAEEINELLRNQPKMVARFFDRAWVEPFCGAEAASSLPPTRLSSSEVRNLRVGLLKLYQAAFASLTSPAPVSGREDEPFVVLKVSPQPETQLGAQVWDEGGGRGVDSPRADSQRVSAHHEDAQQSSDYALGTGPVLGENTSTASKFGRHRPSLRPVRALLNQASLESVETGNIPADEWLAGGGLNLVIGTPGAGKSSLLRFVATDLLSPRPESTALQRQHSDRLPVWLPFGYLCHHLKLDDSNSLLSAVRAWLTSHGRGDLYGLVERALGDERLLLLIDGIDEWTTEAAANIALNAIETFLGHTNAAAFITSRPYAVARLPIALTWRRASIVRLDDLQQRRIAGQYLMPPAVTAAGTEEADAGGEAAFHMWSQSNVDPFLAQLASVSELWEFARTPLMLALLARSWRGEPLPPRRYDLYEVIVKMLVETHPTMRARASRASAGPLTTGDFLTLIDAVAFRIKVEDLPQPLAHRAFQSLMTEALADDDVLGLSPPEARTMAAAAMTMAEDEFGLVVPQGAGHVGFVHRVIMDQLAGRHLARTDPVTQKKAFRERHLDPVWEGTLLAALNAQASPHAVADLLDAVIAAADGPDSAAHEWPDSVLRHEAAWKFVAEALAADARIVPRKASELVDHVVQEVEGSPSLTYSADLIGSLGRASTIPAYWRRLAPTFRRWLDSTRAWPASAMWALCDIQIDDYVAHGILLHGMRHRDGQVRSSATEAFARRFGNYARNTVSDPARASSDLPDTSPASPQRPVDLALLDLIRTGPDTVTQATALMALCLGWPTDPVTLEFREWARRQPKTNLRTVALHNVAKQSPDRVLRDLLEPAEVDWVLEYLHGETYLTDHDWTGLNVDLIERLVAEADEAEQQKFAEFVLRGLQGEQGWGDRRGLSWRLACGPLAWSQSLRDWVVDELSASDKDRPLRLYNLAAMPPAWLAHRPLQDAIQKHIDGFLSDPWSGGVYLTRFLPDDAARVALLKALDGYRPGLAARELLDRFRDDSDVATELRVRLSDDKQVGRLANIALDFLGAADGFGRIFSALQAANRPSGDLGLEAQVLLASEVATAWRELTKVARGAESTPVDEIAQVPMDQGVAAAVRGTYLDEDVCAACMVVPTDGFVGWHMPEVIRTWPTRTIDYTLAELRSSRHVTEGIDDAAHSAALLAHAGRPSDRSDEVLNLALDLMHPLPAELREVLVHELALAPISPQDLMEVTGQWLNDPDDGVRRTAAVGISQAILRRNRGIASWSSVRTAGGHEVAPELAAWRATIRSQLCVYGPNHEENRQNAWVCMLLLGEPELIDGLRETIGDPTEPGVRITDIFGNPDALLVELLGQNWSLVTEHFGESLLDRLAGSRQKAERDSHHVAAALAAGASASPPLARIIRQQLASQSREPAGDLRASGKPSHEDLVTAPAVVDFLIAQEGHTLANLKRVLAASGFETRSGRFGRDVEKWALTRLLEVWDVGTDLFHQTLAEGSTSKDNSMLALSALAMLFPRDELTQKRYQELDEWFRRPSGKRDRYGPMGWLEAISLAFSASAAEDLPALVHRLFNPRRLEIANEPLWKFTAPLLHRLRGDADAVQILIDSLDGRLVKEATPVFAIEGLRGRVAPTPEEDVARRVFVTARVLEVTGHLVGSHQETVLQLLRHADPRTTVIDPFVEGCGPLGTLGARLAVN